MKPPRTGSGFKIAFIGPCGSGKTSIIDRFHEGDYSAETESTIGASFISHDVQTDTGTISLAIWDTAGQERYKSLVPMYCRNAVALVVVYDTSAMESFNESKMWCERFRSSDDSIRQEVYFIGNKIDLEPAVDEGMARDYAESVHAHYHLTSAKTGQGITALFHAIAERIVASKSATVTTVPVDKQNSRNDSCC
jgi:Ras-related protein Rab-5C